MKQNKILSLIYILCLLFASFCKNVNDACSYSNTFDKSSNQECLVSVSSKQEETEKHYCNFDDVINVYEPISNYMFYTYLDELGTININETENIEFTMNFESYIHPSKLKKNIYDYYFSFQYSFKPNMVQGIPFYIEKNTDFYMKHFYSQFESYCDIEERRDFSINVSIPTKQFYKDCSEFNKKSVLNIYPCFYANEDGYSYTNGVKDEHLDQEIGPASALYYELGDDTITFSPIMF